MMNNKILLHALLIMCVTCLLMSCSEYTNKLSLDERSIIYCSEGSPDSFNPQLSSSGTTSDATSKLLYNNLVVFEESSNQLTSSIAKSWHVTKDGKKITFYLRQDVEFHQTQYFLPTRKLNADDIIFTFNRILNSEHPYHQVSGGHYPFFHSVKFSQQVERIEKINDFTVRFILKQNNSSFLANLTTDYAIILSAEYGQQLLAQGNPHHLDIMPIGTGPFKLKDYRVGSLIRYYRHNQYWQDKAKIEHLVFDISPRETNRLTKLLAKECDVSSYPIAHQKIAQRDDLILESITALNVGYLGFNTKKPPFDNKIVRQAVSMAINKKAIIDTVYQGQAVQAKSIIPETSWAYNESSPEHTYNPEKAKQLLTIAGYTHGFDMDIWAMPVQRAYNPNALTMAKLIQADLKKIGINVKIVSYEWSTFLRQLSQGGHQSFLLGWSADHPDPDNFFSPILGCSEGKLATNQTFWCNKKYDKLLKKALSTNNIALRKHYYHDAMTLIFEETPLLPIAHSKRFQSRDKRVVGQIISNFGGLSFHHVYKKIPLKKNKANDLINNSIEVID